jgi:SAM-dependent methyltransferase
MTTAPAPPTDGYEEFARFYDAFTSGSDYEMWTSQMLGLARRHGLAGTRLLDVACGTGKSFLPFLQRGFDVTGCDASPAMLAEAARKAPGVPLVEADMRTLPRLGSFDLVTCFDDSLNHLLDEDGLASAFASLAENLDPAGLLLFDLNTLLAFRTTFAVDSVLVHDTATFLTRGNSSADAPPGCLATVDVDVVWAREDGLYERLGARLQERHFPPHRVTSLLALARLECVGVHGVLDNGTPVPQPDETRQLKLIYAATLAKGGDPE